ncbi:sirohydrochlorin cobaltochelatase [Acidaminobacter sp. JC074]|uniref:sirohydrochlorin cobaltochelatase n=1 Tax=Acidaminobacter sp. JC074 TaxID=2530199 RepID=UPI001F112C0C|nr:sirohydrochlorin cobaltochelatase [Acidaminobacter sp. JC074]MCH4886556.1 sirohydrochlorin cobaltochelatase [Acidaminobacter sp. JC074]
MKKGIIVASFGTSFTEVRKRSIEHIENMISEAFDKYEVRRAFTSNMIIKKLRQRDGLIIDTPSEAISRMVDEGIHDIHVQPLHVIPGYEYEKVKSAVKKYNHHSQVHITLGKPLLCEEGHYDQMVDILDKRLKSKDNHAYVLMGHGTEHHANACYSMLQAKLNDNRNDMFIANVEGYPEIDHILLKVKRYEKVSLMPLMIVAGDHAMNDMAGEDDESYKSILEGEGIEVKCLLEGLGENEAIGRLFINRINEMRIGVKDV